MSGGDALPACAGASGPGSAPDGADSPSLPAAFPEAAHQFGATPTGPRVGTGDEQQLGVAQQVEGAGERDRQQRRAAQDSRADRERRAAAADGPDSRAITPKPPAEERALLVADHDGVRTLTLNRPHRRNAIDGALWLALAEALRSAADDRSVRALVLTGAGGAFCSGADISVPDNSHPIHRMRPLTDVAALLYESPLPTVAKVTGPAFGAGWNLALGCDLVVATPESTFSQVFTKRGLTMDLGGSWLLPRLVGMQQAKRLAMLAETIDAAQAHELGLVTWVVPAAEIDGFTEELAARLAAGPPVALAQTKALLHEGSDATMYQALAAEARAQGLNLATADAPEAYAAFAERREPRFTGRWTVHRPPIRPATSENGR